MKVLGFSGLGCSLLTVLLTVLLAGCDRLQQSAHSAQKVETETTSSPQVAGAPDQGGEEATDLSDHPGKWLHDANCISCHDALVYSREDRKIGNFTLLQQQVKRCDANLGSRLSDEDLQQVTAYLNQAYYHFSKE